MQSKCWVENRMRDKDVEVAILKRIFSKIQSKGEESVERLEDKIQQLMCVCQVCVIKQENSYRVIGKDFFCPVNPQFFLRHGRTLQACNV
jgi:hypothetical protein